MAYQKKFWKGQATHLDKEDRIRSNPEAPPMHKGPGEQDTDMPTGSDAPKLGSSQPKSGNPGSGELPLPSQKKKHKGKLHQVMCAKALREHENAEK